MIYLDNIQDRQVVAIPWNGISFVADDPISLDIKSTIDLDSSDIQVSVISRDLIYVNAEVSLPEDLPDGEYEYTLVSHGDEDVELSSGLLVIGGLTQPSEYEKEIQYEQYTRE